MVPKLGSREHGQEQSGLLAAGSHFGDLHESASPILLHVQIKPLGLNLQHFRGQLLLLTTAAIPVQHVAATTAAGATTATVAANDGAAARGTGATTSPYNGDGKRKCEREEAANGAR